MASPVTGWRPRGLNHTKTTHVARRQCSSRLAHLPYVKREKHLEHNDQCQQGAEVESDDEERLIVDDVEGVARDVKLGKADPFRNSPAMTPDC